MDAEVMKMIEEEKAKEQKEKKEIAPLVEDKSMREVSENVIKDIEKNVAERKISYSDASKDIANALMTGKSFDETDDTNKKFIDKAKSEKQRELTQDFVARRIKAEAEKIASTNTKAEAFYKHWRPILEFDLSNLINIKNKEEKERKTYSDRAYGIPLMVIMLMLLTIPYCLFVIILSAFNGINAIFEALNQFGKIARGICITLLIIGVVILIFYIVLGVLENNFNITIPKINK